MVFFILHELTMSAPAFLLTALIHQAMCPLKIRVLSRNTAGIDPVPPAIPVLVSVLSTPASQKPTPSSVIYLLADHCAYSHYGLSGVFRICRNNTPYNSLYLDNAASTNLTDSTGCEEVRLHGPYKRLTRVYHAQQKPSNGLARKCHLPTRHRRVQAVDKLLLGAAGVRSDPSMRRSAPRRSAALHGRHCPKVPL